MSAVISPKIGLRPMSEADLDAVVALERETYHFPWTRGIFRDCLNVGYACWVYEEEQIDAYCVMSLGAGEAHILTLVVAEQQRSKGLGRMLMNHMLSVAKQHNTEVMLLEVRPSNKVAIRLYQALGFNEVGIRPDYYPSLKGREDALVMAKVMIGSDDS